LTAHGAASGAKRAIEAVNRAMSSPFLAVGDIHHAQAILVNVTGNEDLTLAEYDEAVSIIHNMVDEGANIICGMLYDQEAGDEISVTVVAMRATAESKPCSNIDCNDETFVVPAFLRRRDG